MIFVSKEKGFAGWFDTSAKQNINIDKAARFLVDQILLHKDVFSQKKVAQVLLCSLVGSMTTIVMRSIWYRKVFSLGQEEVRVTRSRAAADSHLLRIM